MLTLTHAEKAMLAGDEGPGVRRAMEIVVALAEVARAERLVEVESVQVAGVSYRNLGEAGLEFLRSWAAEGGRARVPAWMNPCGADLASWRKLRYSPDFIEKQRQVVAALEALGVAPSLTCTPYHVCGPPRAGAHLAWSESSAVAVANSVFGARTNREGGPSALAAAICGRTGFTGFHLDAGRVATHRVDVRCEVSEPSDYGALGVLVGAQVGDGVPYFTGLQCPPGAEGMSRLKQLAAALGAEGAVALFHVEGATPEADAPGVLPDGVPVIRVDDLEPGRWRVRRRGEGVDLVALGCPHLSLEEVAQAAGLLAGRRTRAPLWISMSRAVAEQAAAAGLTAAIESAGADIVCDTCVVVAPLESLGYRNVATNSAKAAIYLGMHGDGAVWFGTLAECVEAAVTGAWPGAGGAKVALKGRAVVRGEAEGELLCTAEPISFYGGVDPETGEVRDRRHELFGRCIAGRVLAFPTGKGSTVGSYVLYALKRNGCAPAALLVERADPIVAAGAVIAGLPMVEGIDVSRLPLSGRARVRGDEVVVE